MAVIVAQPTFGLSEITTSAAEKFASVIQGYEEQGASMLIEFGHEMNGNWYAWGQQPSEYVKAFQTVSTAIAKVRAILTMCYSYRKLDCVHMPFSVRYLSTDQPWPCIEW